MFIIYYFGDSIFVSTIFYSYQDELMRTTFE